MPSIGQRPQKVPQLPHPSEAFSSDLPGCWLWLAPCRPHITGRHFLLNLEGCRVWLCSLFPSFPVITIMGNLCPDIAQGGAHPGPGRRGQARAASFQADPCLPGSAGWRGEDRALSRRRPQQSHMGAGDQNLPPSPP